MAQKGSIEVTFINNSIAKLYVNNYAYMYVFKGDQGVLLIDTGYETDGGLLKNKLKEFTTGQVMYIINTHSNGDHVQGNHFFPSATIIAHQNCRNDLLRTDEFPKSGLPNLTFQDQLTLYFNNEEIKLFSFHGGHTNNDIVVYFPHQKLLFVGDIVIPDTFPVVWSDYFENTSVDKHVLILERMLSLFPDDMIIISSHGRDYSKNDLKDYQKMIVETISIVRNAINQGKNLEQIKKENLLEDYRTFDSHEYSFINAEFWIETIFNNTKKANNG